MADWELRTGRNDDPVSGLASLRHGRWQDVLSDVAMVDAIVSDPPFSERTAKGYRHNPDYGDIGEQDGIAYGYITEGDAREFVEAWSPRTRYWMVLFGDHVSAQWWAAALEAVRWYVFAPIPYIKTDAPPRFIGDGPSSAAEWITVARPRSNSYKERRGHRPGYYVAQRGDAAITGAKHVPSMRALVSDYAQPGDLVCDPYAGSGAILTAARMVGCRVVGSEVNAATYEIARRRIAGDRAVPVDGQMEMF